MGDKTVEHTALPWEVQAALGNNPNLLIVGGGGLIARVSGSGPVAEKGFEANADFIVRACNSHYDLLATCKHALTLVWPENTIEAAIAKAEGRDQAEV